MADSRIVSVSELRSCLQDIRRDGMDYVELSISEPDEFDGDIIPSLLHLSGCKKHDDTMWVDYEPIESIDAENSIKEKSFAGIHISSDMI